MPVTVQCPQCSKSLNVPDAMLGQRGRCPACNHVFVLSDGSIQAAPSAPMPPAPPAGNFGYPQKDYAADRGNAFDDFHSGRQAVYTPPSTFNHLFFWYLGLMATEIVVLVGVVVLFVVVAAASEPPRPNRGFQNQRLDNDPFATSSRTSSSSSDDMAALMVLPILGVVLLFGIAQVVVYYMLIYKAWALIQDGSPRTTPGQAVGFCFIPFFNFYWWFVAIRGLAEDLNGYAHRRGLRIREASVGLATAYLVVRFLNFVPCVNYLAGIPTLILDILTLNTLRNAAADIAAAKAG